MAVMKTVVILSRRVMNNVPPNCSFSTGVLRCAAADAAAKDSPHNRKKELFDRDKLCINVGTLGASQHGKTTLSSAFTRVLSQSHGVPFLNIGDIDHTKLEKDNKHSQNTKNLYWWTDDWFVAHSDLPGLSNYAKNTWAPLSVLDAVLLCVRADKGVAKETLIHYHVAKHMGVPTILPFINVCGEEDEELADFVKMELEEHFTAEEMNRAVVGNAVDAQTGKNDAAVLSVIDALKRDLSLRPRDVDAPFLLQVESSGDIPNKGHFTGGRVVQGTTKTGDKDLEVFVGGITSKVVFQLDLEINRAITSELRPGDRGGGWIKKANKIVEIRRGSLIYDHETVKEGWKASRTWKVRVQGIPGQGLATIAENQRATLYHRGNNESVNMPACAVSDKHDFVLNVALKQEILAKIGDPIILGKTEGFLLLGHLLDAI